MGLGSHVKSRSFRTEIIDTVKFQWAGILESLSIARSLIQESFKVAGYYACSRLRVQFISRIFHIPLGSNAITAELRNIMPEINKRMARFSLLFLSSKRSFKTDVVGLHFTEES
jgi:hypothetical protein